MCFGCLLCWLLWYFNIAEQPEYSTCKDTHCVREWKAFFKNSTLFANEILKFCIQFLFCTFDFWIFFVEMRCVFGFWKKCKIFIPLFFDVDCISVFLTKCKINSKICKGLVRWLLKRKLKSVWICRLVCLLNLLYNHKNRQYERNLAVYFFI